MAHFVKSSIPLFFRIITLSLPGVKNGCPLLPILDTLDTTSTQQPTASDTRRLERKEKKKHIRKIVKSSEISQNLFTENRT